MEKTLFFFIVVGIPVIAAMSLKAWSRYLKFRERELAAVSSETAERAAQYASHVERLEQRVRVLERIVTDRGHDLAGEIEALREPPAPLN